MSFYSYIYAFYGQRYETGSIYKGQIKHWRSTSAFALKDTDAHAPFSLNFLSSSAKVLNF